MKNKKVLFGLPAVLSAVGAVLAVMTFGGCSNPSGGGGKDAGPVVAHDITAAEVNACPAIGGFKDIDALIESKLAGDANDTFTFPAGVNVAVSVGNIGRARITIPAGIIKGVKGVSTEAQLNTYKATATWIDTLSGMKIPYTLPAAQVAHKVAFAELGGAELVPVYVRSGMIDQVNTSTGAKVQRQFVNNVALFFYGETVADATAAEALLNAQNLHLSAGQPIGTEPSDHLDGKVAWYVMSNGLSTGDVARLRAAVVMSAGSTFPELTISGLGTVASGSSGAFTYNTAVASLMKPKYTLKSVLGDIQVSQATYVAAVAAQKPGLYS